eukprot:scaffold118740_cov30-Tisochrysis_lutea.AAC.3
MQYVGSWQTCGRTGANEDAIHAKLHEQGGISGGGNTAGGKVDNGESSNLGCLLEQMERSLNLSKLEGICVRWPEELAAMFSQPMGACHLA